MRPRFDRSSIAHWAKAVVVCKKDNLTACAEFELPAQHAAACLFACSFRAASIVLSAAIAGIGKRRPSNCCARMSLRDLRPIPHQFAHIQKIIDATEHK